MQDLAGVAVQAQQEADLVPGGVLRMRGRVRGETVDQRFRVVRAAGGDEGEGGDGVRQAFEKLLSDLPNAEWDVPTQVFEGDVLFIEWNAKAAESYAEDGIDTFVFRDGLIRVQTVRYTLQRS